jgi:transitional endoplasmic reticulum ATPase
MKDRIPSFFMICRNQTEQECLDKGLFGDREWRLPYIKSVQKGDLGFLLNVSQDCLLGIFEAEGPARLNIDQAAWGGGFPAQIKVRQVGDLQRIKSASAKLASFMTLREIRRHPKSYKVPAQNAYGPDITQKVLSLFEAPREVSAVGKREEEVGFIPETALKDVAGLRDIKNFVYQRIIAPFEDDETAFSLKLRVGGGMLLYGPPGTGKTLIATAIAADIQAKFIDVGPSVIVGYPGEAERRLENMFASLEREPRAVVFLDEAEWILCKRVDQSSSVMQRITPVLLAQLSRIFKQKTRPIVVIAATNKPEMIDPAFLRPGRFEKVFLVGLPEKEARNDILKVQLSSRSHRIDERELAELTARMDGYSGADIEHIIEEAAFMAFARRNQNEGAAITLADIQSAIDNTPKSVSPAEIKRFEDWARKMGRQP